MLLYIAGVLTFMGFGFLILGWVVEHDAFKLGTWGRLMLITAAVLIVYRYYDKNYKNPQMESTKEVMISEQ